MIFFSLDEQSQTEELYEEILYEILHNVGCETENVTCQSTLYSYIQDAFKVISIPMMMAITSRFVRSHV